MKPHPRLADMARPEEAAALTQLAQAIAGADGQPPAQVIDAMRRYLAAGAHAEGGALAPHLHPAACAVSIVDAAKGIIRMEPKRKKLAIVGFSQSSLHLAPYNDPTWVVAGLNQLGRYVPRADVWFELHQRDVFVADTVRGTDYTGWLQRAPFPVFMEPGDFDEGRFQDMPQAVRFPIEACVDLVGAYYRPDGTPVALDYYESTIALMIAWGVLAGFEEIGIWGVDLIVAEEYAYQKPNAEFWLGFCQGRGIKLTLPEQSALLRPSQPHRYGRALVEPPNTPFTAAFFDTILKNALDKREQLLTELNNTDGAILTIKNLRDAQIIYARGGTLKDVEAAKAEATAPPQLRRKSA